MKGYSPKQLVAIALAFASIALATIASGETCSNSCVTMAIPRSSEGVHTKLDGTADAVLWPPGKDLRKIRISALNDRSAPCDVTIHDVRQDEAPGVAGSGATIDDAVNCINEGQESSVELRSDRDADGNGRAYHIRFKLNDPDCTVSAKADEVLVVVPHDETVTSLKTYADDGALTASYSGPALNCSPPRDDRLASSQARR